MKNKLTIATFNLENLDDIADKKPSLADRIAVLRPQLVRLNADVLCLQEVHGQETEGEPRRLLALRELLKGTEYENFHLVNTTTIDKKQVYDKRNLVIVSRYEIDEFHQYKHDYALAPHYKKVMADPEEEAKEISWERPILHAVLKVGSRKVHIINLHLKSRLPASVKGQQLSRRIWKSAAGWAEGFFIASMKRVGQAMETRMLLDDLFDKDEKALIAVCGDLNASAEEVPIEAICGDVEQTGNANLVGRVLIPCERALTESKQYSLYHHGKGRLLDHLLASRELMAWFRGADIHNEMLHDESVAYASEKIFPESDHAPLLGFFELPDE